MSHCFLMQTPAYPRPFIITDAAINIAPTLKDKADIVRNAVDLAHAFGIARPRVAILAAVETINPNMPATLDAAALCKMADRGQIAGARARRAARVRQRRLGRRGAHQGHRVRRRGLRRHPGRARSGSGNMLAKQLEYLGGAASAGIVVGRARARSCSPAAPIRASRASRRALWRSWPRAAAPRSCSRRTQPSSF